MNLFWLQSSVEIIEQQRFCLQWTMKQSLTSTYSTPIVLMFFLVYQIKRKQRYKLKVKIYFINFLFLVYKSIQSDHLVVNYIYRWSDRGKEGHLFFHIFLKKVSNMKQNNVTFVAPSLYWSIKAVPCVFNIVAQTSLGRRWVLIFCPCNKNLYLLSKQKKLYLILQINKVY